MHLERRHALSARRIWDHCGESAGKNTAFDTVLSKGIACHCSEFLSKPEHHCESGEFHFCNKCLNTLVLPELKQVNTGILKCPQAEYCEEDIEVSLPSVKILLS